MKKFICPLLMLTPLLFSEIRGNDLAKLKVDIQEIRDIALPEIRDHTKKIAALEQKIASIEHRLEVHDTKIKLIEKSFETLTSNKASSK